MNGISTSAANVSWGDQAAIVHSVATNNVFNRFCWVKQLAAVDGVFAASQHTAVVDIGDFLVACIDTCGSDTWAASDGQTCRTIVAGVGAVSDVGARTTHLSDFAAFCNGYTSVINHRIAGSDTI